MAAASVQILDMTNVKEGGSFNKKRMPEGDYLARVTKVEDAPVKNGENKGKPQWLFTIKLETGSGTYPYYCQFAENQLWKIRNLLVAAGVNVPKKRMRLDPEKVVGKLIAVTLEDEEYEGKNQSTIGAIFPPSEMTDAEDDGEDEEDEEDEEESAPPVRKKRAPEPEPEEEEDEEEEEEEPALVVRKKRKPTPPPVEEEDEEEDEEDEVPPPPPKKRGRPRKVAPPIQEDEDEEEEEEEETPPPPRRKKRQVTADELEELDIEDI